jgi:hypothetical protein
VNAGRFELGIGATKFIGDENGQEKDRKKGCQKEDEDDEESREEEGSQSREEKGTQEKEAGAKGRQEGHKEEGQGFEDEEAEGRRPPRYARVNRGRAANVCHFSRPHVGRTDRHADSATQHIPNRRARAADFDLVIEHSYPLPRHRPATGFPRRNAPRRNAPLTK